MRSSWADLVANADGVDASRLSRQAYVPPHLRNRRAPSDLTSLSVLPAAEPTARTLASLPTDGGGGARLADRGGDVGRRGLVGPGRTGWNGRNGGWDREANPFAKEEKDAASTAQADLEGQENSGINFDTYEDIPVETSGENVPLPVNTFAEIDLGRELNENIRRCKYVKPTPVQRHAIPISLAGRDLMACAQTGSGKTAAFCFPIISGIMRSGPENRPRVSRTAYPFALILSPTRELSVQIHEEARKFAYQTGVRIVVAYGGAPINQQMRDLERGVDILVATPGRLVDLLERARVSLQMIRDWRPTFCRIIYFSLLEGLVLVPTLLSKELNLLPKLTREAILWIFCMHKEPMECMESKP